MGTNYYWHEKEPCKCCKRDYKPIHIGKSSIGWTFTFHGTDDITSYKDWIKCLESGGIIKNEYDDIVELDWFKELVEHKKNDERTHSKEYITDTWVDSEGHGFSGHEFC